MDKDIKKRILELSNNVTESGHQMCDWLEDLHENVTKNLSKEEQEKMGDDEDIQLAQADMDALHKRMEKLNIV